MKLHEFSNGLYPRRVTIYLAEKGLHQVDRVSHDPTKPWPPQGFLAINPRGTVPVLELDDGRAIRSSLAILEYLEEVFPQPTMLGDEHVARAQVREMASIADELTTHFTVWSHKGSDMYVRGGHTNKDVGGFAALKYHERLDQIEEFSASIGGRFLAGDSVTIADCVLMATVQFADALYGVKLPSSTPRLSRWYSDFLARPSATGCEYPEVALKVARGLLEQCPPGEQTEARLE